MPESEACDNESLHWPHQRSSKFIEAAGIRWHVQTMGEGPPLLLVHGTGASTHSWRDVMPILAGGYTTLAFDLPGHGFTGPARPGASSIAGMGAAIAELLAALNFKPQYCVGHSAGAAILCQMSLDRRIEPRVITSINGAFLPLTGIASVLFAPLAGVLARSSFMPGLLARRAASPANVARLLASTGSRLDDTGVAFYGRLVRNPRHLAGALAMMAAWDLRRFMRDLPRLTSPLALLVAACDRTVPAEQAKQVKRLVPQATICELPALGHLAHEEAPQLVSAEIARICHQSSGSA